MLILAFGFVIVAAILNTILCFMDFNVLHIIAAVTSLGSAICYYRLLMKRRKNYLNAKNANENK